MRWRATKAVRGPYFGDKRSVRSRGQGPVRAFSGTTGETGTTRSSMGARLRDHRSVWCLLHRLNQSLTMPFRRRVALRGRVARTGRYGATLTMMREGNILSTYIS